MENMTIERTFSISAPARLHLTNIRGSVNVQAGPVDEINVTAVIMPESGSFEHTRVLIEQTADGEVRAETRCEDGFSILKIHEPCKVDYTVRVPADCQLTLNGVSSRIEAAGMRGEIQVETVSGKIELSTCTGELRLQSVSGKIRGERLSGPLTLETVSGEAWLESCSFPSLQARTVSGDLHLETPLSNAVYRFHSVSGDVLLVVPEVYPHRVRLKSLSGKLVDEMQNQRLPAASASSDQGADIVFDSVSGDLRLSLRAAVAA